MLTLNNNVCLPHVEVGHAESSFVSEKRLPSVSSSRRKTSMMAISVSDICENTKVGENEYIVSGSFNLSFFSAGPRDEPVGQL